jgi:SMC interacting uncharacterized protein involved in chromosome segregation
VEEMERERQKLDRQLDVAQEKSKRANLGQEVLEAKMKVKSFFESENRDLSDFCLFFVYHSTAETPRLSKAKSYISYVHYFLQLLLLSHIYTE